MPIVDRYRAGAVEPTWFRGRSSLSNVAQAAESYAREMVGDDGVRAFTVLSEQRTDDGWRVEFGHRDRPVVVDLTETLSEPLLSTCGATREVAVRQFALTAVRPLVR